ncbi:hypothetical protein CCH79_00005788 [Gambusia affinis]|uniref:Uncharacterized protein n=1 Tax=Gambusia affinis TaxID=33528 RepID=A0A315VKD8_GAMAF|nr:hypothetical protein CCH79_00005788 [Gambusia affinis]
MHKESNSTPVCRNVSRRSRLCVGLSSRARPADLYYQQLLRRALVDRSPHLLFPCHIAVSDIPNGDQHLYMWIRRLNGSLGTEHSGSTQQMKKRETSRRRAPHGD